MERIEKFDELIKDYIGPNKTIVDTKVTNLTAPGENYMSEIVKIDVILKNIDSGDNEDLHVVAKLVTENEFMGSTSNLTKNEILFYKDIITSLKRFQEKQGVPVSNFFPDFIGGRINLTGGDKADKNAVLVLENLKEKGYENLDRHVGFDLKTAKFVLDDLATFHAVPLAMKLLEPEVFETEIKSKCLGMQERPGGPPGGPPDGPPGGPPGGPEGGPIAALNLVLEMLKRDKQYSHVILKCEKYIKEVTGMMKNNPEAFFKKKIVEPFATLTHNDMWLNNTMQLLKNGVVVKNKLVDFQMCEIASPVPDLVFLLFSSVEIACLREHLDDLIKHYYQTFSNILKKFHCYGPQFSYDKFLEELKQGAHHCIEQCVFMTINVIFAKKGKVMEPQKVQDLKHEDVHPIAKEKVMLLFVEASKRGWL